MTNDDYDREIARRVRNRRIATALNVVQAVLLSAAVVLLFALFCAATPDQMSGEFDWAVEEGSGVAE